MLEYRKHMCYDRKRYGATYQQAFDKVAHVHAHV